MLIAQISDLHVQAAGQKAYGIVDTNQLVRVAVQQLNCLSPQPDVVIATGDLVDQRTVAEYEMLRELLAPLRAPLYLALGNHDDRSCFRQVWGDLPYLPPTGFVQYSIDDFPVRLILLDTLVEGAGHGCLDEERLAWLAARLAEKPDHPTLIGLHHPPFATGLPGMDDSRCQGHEALASLIARYPCVQRVVCGHLHRSIQTSWAGTLASVAPSVAHQIALRFTTDLPAAFVLEPPAFHLHLWQASLGIITHTAYVGDFPAYAYRTHQPVALYA